MLKLLRFILQSFCLQFIRKKTIVLFTVIFTLLEMYTFPVIQYSREVNYPVSLWIFPFILSDIYFLFLFLCCIFYYNTDIPFFQDIQSYRMIRMGRSKWLTGQSAALLLRCFCIMLITAGLSAVQILPWTECGSDWGKLIYTIAFSGTEINYDLPYIRYEALEKFTPIQLMTLGILIGTLVLTFLSMVTLLFSLLFNKIVGTAVSGILSVFMFVCQNQLFFKNGVLRFFSPATWMRVMWISGKRYGISVLPPIAYILGVLSGSILLLQWAVLRRIQKAEILWEKEDG